MGIPNGAPVPVGQPLRPAFLVAIGDRCPVLREFSNSLHSSATNCSLSSITEHSLHSILSPSQKGKSVTAWVRYDLTRNIHDASATIWKPSSVALPLVKGLDLFAVTLFVVLKFRKSPRRSSSHERNIPCARTRVVYDRTFPQ